MSVLAGYHKNLFVVGDPDQTIYTWRGADVRFLLDFDKAFPDTRTIMMLENYRSTPEVIAVANSLIEKNRQRIPKDLCACRTQHGPTVWHHAKTSDDEAKWIAEGVRALHDGGIRYRDMAVLYRAHYASRPVEEAFLKAGIPHAVYSGVPFYGRKEIKDSLAYLRLVAYQDDLSFMRVANVPKRNLGQRRMAFLKDYAEAHACSLFQALEQTIEDEIFKRTKAKQLVALVRKFRGSFEGRPVSEVLAALINESGYEQVLRTEGSQERLDNVAGLKQSIYEFENSCGEEVTLEHYLSHVALLTNADALDEAQDKVRLMTIHAAKGLEFPHVFLCSLSEGVLPSRKTKTLEGMEEERRLAFVAVTRARDGPILPRRRASRTRVRRATRRASCSISISALCGSRTSQATRSYPARGQRMPQATNGWQVWRPMRASRRATACSTRRSGGASSSDSTRRSVPTSCISTRSIRRAPSRFGRSSMQATPRETLSV